MNTISSLDKTQTITVNGVVMSLAEYKAYKKANAEKKCSKKARKSPKVIVNDVTIHKDITTISTDVEKLVKSAAPFKSLSVFYRHAYRSYGLISQEIMKPYMRLYTLYQSKWRDVENMINVMHDCSKKKESEVFDFAVQLSWRLDDMKVALNKLIDKVRDNYYNTSKEFKGQPVFEGRMLGGKTPRELGFKQQLFAQSPQKIWKTMNKLEDAVETIKKWGEIGRDPFTYKIR
jgi:hypothetical protein